MSELSFRWFVLTVDVSIKALVLAAGAGFGLWALRVRDSSAKHAAWVGVLLGMLALPLLALTLPGIALPLPGRLAAFLRNESASARIAEPASGSDSARATLANPIRPMNAGRNRQADSLPTEPAAEFADEDMRSDHGPLGSIAEPSPSRRAGGEPRTGIAAIKPAVMKPNDFANPASAASRRLEANRIPWTLLAGALWAAAALIGALRLLFGIAFARRLVGRAVPVRAPWTSVRDRANNVPPRAGLENDRELDVRESSEIAVPVTAGVFRSTVLVPANWRTWPAEKLFDVLVHEQAHVRRHDCLTACLAELATCLYWFHPVAWRLRRRLALLAEAACDDAAISSTGNRPAYARHLLEIAGVLAGRSGRVLYPGVSMARQSNVESRIDAILDFNRPLSRRLTWTATLLVGSAVAPLVGVAAALRPSIDSSHRVSAPVIGPLSGPSDHSAPTIDVKKRIAVNDVVQADQPRQGASPGRSTSAPTVPLPNASNEGLLTVTGRVLLPDGSPAADAFVSAVGNRDERGTTVRADATGRFRLQHAFGTHCFLHAHTPDWRQQATFSTPAALARVILAHPIELKLAPAHRQHVSVTSEGKPAAGVRVIGAGGPFKVEGRTGPDGRAALWLPADRKLVEIDAWDPKLGGAGRSFFGRHRLDAREALLELPHLSPRPHTIRVVDPAAKPVPGLSLWISCVAASDKWFSTEAFDEAVLKTDSQGEVTVPWVPATLDYVQLDRADRPVKFDEVAKPSKTNRGLTIMPIRKMLPVTGRLVMPPGQSAEGILVTGFAFSLGSRGDIPHARARRDGTFTFLAASDHGYILGIADREWAADPWTGVVLPGDDAPAAKVTLNVYRAVPLTVQATRGANPEPWRDLWIDGERRQEFRWTDSHGESHNCSGAVGFDLFTDANGIAQFGVGRGTYNLRFSSGTWWEERAFKVGASNEPVSIKLHRPWLDRRVIAGRLTRKGAPFSPTAATTVRGWSVGQPSTLGESKLLGDGRFTAIANSPRVCLYATDEKERLNAFLQIGPEDPPTHVEAPLVPTGVYSGEVVDQNGKPVPKSTIRLIPKPIERHLWMVDPVLEETVCDERGRFKFDNAPTGVTLLPLVMEHVAKGMPPQPMRMMLRDLRLKPGETFADDRIEIEIGESKPAGRRRQSEPKRSLAEKLAASIRDAGVANMRVLVAAKGDATKPVDETLKRLLDDEVSKEILRYLPIVVDDDDRREESDFFARLKVPPPQAGEILLDVLDGDGRPIDVLHLAAADIASACRRGAPFSP
ncbi:MAG TPA: M56 family metallopeptidase, partial [Planctomycetaceae bacterium]|nr:M56 family metallopeptidase [Planctomycetaceae bacterium]